MNTDDELAVADAATPGPWAVSWLTEGPLVSPTGLCSVGPQKRMIALGFMPSPVGQPERREADLEAIVRARTGYPLALAVVKAVQALREAATIDERCWQLAQLDEAVAAWEEPS